MIVFPNAKINLGLCITGKRSDGYHNLSSVFYPVTNCCDILEAVQVDLPDGQCSIETPGTEVVQDPADNLVARAYRLLAADYRLPGTHFVLKKNLPTGAGLGGGSSDAAFALRLLSEKYHLKLSRGQLLAYAGKLGSDVPFFIDNVPSAVSGRGEVLEPCSVNLRGYFLLLVHPGIFVSTAEAYRMIRPGAPHLLPADATKEPVARWKDLLVNDFEVPLFNTHPRIAALKESIYRHGALFAMMSGSGSSVFGIFSEEPPPFEFPGASYCRVISL